MAGVLDTFLIMFEADAHKLHQGLGEARKEGAQAAEQIGKLDLQALKLGENFLGMAKKAAGLLGVGFSLAAIAHGIKETANETEALRKLAEQLGSTADAVDEFVDAGSLLGVESKTSEEGLRSLSRAVEDTALGLGRAKKVFEELGVTVLDVHGKALPTTEVMGKLAEKFKTMERGAQIRVMERLGLDPALLKIFNSDLAMLQGRMAQIDQATKFNLDTAIKKSKEFTKVSKDLGVEVQSIRMFFEKFFAALNVQAMPLMTAGLKKAGEILNSVFNFVTRHSDFVRGALIAISGAVMYFLLPSLIAAGAAAFTAMAPFLLIGAVVAGLIGLFALAYDDVVNFMDGNDSAIGEISRRWPVMGQIIRDTLAWLFVLGNVAKAVFGLLVDLIDDPEQAWQNFLDAMSSGLNGLQEKFPEFVAQIKAVQLALTDAAEWVVNAWSKVVSILEKVAAAIKFATELIPNLSRGVSSLLGWDKLVGFMSSGKSQLETYSRAPMAATSSSAISNMTNRSSNMSIGDVTIQTQATDAAGISRDIHRSLESQYRQAANGFDDGVAG